MKDRKNKKNSKKKDAEKLLSWKETWQVHIRALRLIHKSQPGLIMTSLMPCVWSALTPYAGIWLMALILDELAGSRNPERLLRLVLATLLSAALFSLVDAFLKKTDELGIQIMYNTQAAELLEEDGKVTGVKAVSDEAEYTIKAGAVILASGGFGANEEMYTQYRPDLKGTVTTNAPSATGDGIVMAEKAGAALVDIEQIQLHPTVEQTTSMLITESVRGDGAILVNQEGRRFIDEMETRDAVSAAELAQEGQYAYIIFDQNLRDNLKAIEKYVSNGLTVQADTVKGLAELIDADPAVLAETMEKWNKAVADKKDEEFGRDTGMDHDLSTAPYYAIKIAPGIHHTMGGIKINAKAEVLDKDGNAIPGLFAAGEVTGGVHGANRIGGNAVADIVVFGRIASASAAAYVDGAAGQ